MPHLSLRTLIVLAIVGSVVFLTPHLVLLYTDWLWFGEVGYQDVFLRTLTARVALALVVFAFAFAVLYGNVRLAQTGLQRRQFTIMTPQGPHVIAFAPRRFKSLLYGAAAVVAVLLAMYASAQWDVWLMARHAVAFGASDPILGRDASFYVFQLPFLQLLQHVLFTTVLVATIGVTAVHIAGQSLMVGPSRRVLVSPTARRHLSWLAAALLLLMGFDAWLGIAELLTTQSGIVHGASYVDVYARMPVQWILVVVACVGALLAVYQTRVLQLWPILTAVGLYLGVAVIGGLYGVMLQRFFVAPNEQVRETPYHRLQHRRRRAPDSRSTVW